MKTAREAKITICTAPPGLYAVIRNMELPSGSDALHALSVVTAFKYTQCGDDLNEIFSEPLVYCESRHTNALVDGKAKIEFVGSHEECILKIKELITAHYAEKSAKKEGRSRKN